MSRMIDLVRKSEISSNLMHLAARGALSVPPSETIEILVHLAIHNQLFGNQARLTLARWDEKASICAASDPTTSREVLEYMVSPRNLRPALLPALLENSSVSSELLVPLAKSGTREVLKTFLHSLRVRNLPEVLTALQSNPNLTGEEAKGLAAPEEPRDVQLEVEVRGDDVHTEESHSDKVTDEDEHIEVFLKQHAAEIEADANKPFQVIGGVHEETETPAAEAEGEVKQAPPPVAASAPPAAGAKALGAAKAQGKHHSGSPDKRDSTLQKIAKLDIKGRIQLAMKGTKEERSLLVRDGTKLVALAVLESPKISDGEVERIASQKNVLEAVLRQIPMKRRYAKQYPIIRNLVFNPRTPMDVALGLVKNLLVTDLKNLSGNKEVSETIRKMALRMVKQKSDSSARK